ncbi:hypothetical protein VF09_32020, partial [Nostoc linckia z9]
MECNKLQDIRQERKSAFWTLGKGKRLMVRQAHQPGKGKIPNLSPLPPFHLSPGERKKVWGVWGVWGVWRVI